MNTRARSLSGDTDAALVLRARKGDLAAFSQLVSQYQRPLTAKAMSCLRNLEDADDLVQETFLRAFRSLRSFRDDTRFGPWLYRILRNLVIDRSRKAWREIDGAEDALSTLESEARNPEQDVLAAELSERVQKVLDAYPEGRQKEIFRMRFQQGLPIQEIAQRLDLHSGTVKVHLFRSSKRLRKMLTEAAE